ncbi:MAG: radical SAM protein, partial [Eggerthellaceae bacterium]|nr:radical SAM protein [Eggerthellaceae bacterium]
MADSPYILLKRGFSLRGWKGLPYALADRSTGAVAFMRQDAFRVLRFCNGCFSEDSPVFSGKRREVLAQLDAIGALERLNEPAALEADQEYLEYPNRFIRQVHWSITGRCNYRCRHCYMSAPHAALGQPTLDECFGIIDQMAYCGVPFVSLTGGEPLMRHDFMQIVDRILERGIHISVIMTNGSLVTEELLQALKDRGVACEFNMSFDGTGGWH